MVSLDVNEPKPVVLTVEPVRAVEVPVEGGTSDHNALMNRDAADQHPMSAITGLEEALEEKQPKGDYLPADTKIPSKTSDLTNDSGFLTGFTEADPTVPAWAKQASKPAYTPAEVGADPVGTAAAAVSEHNVASEAHNDIRLLISGLNERLNALANSDDTTLDQMAEVVAYIKDNRELIEQVTTGKVSVTDIVDNLTTNVSNQPLSAAQGVVLKTLIDTLTTTVGGKLDASALPEAVNAALAQAKESGEFNGEDGEDGEDGAPGYTPKKGVDYWTDADKAEMVDAVLAALPTYAGEVESA